MQSFQSLTFEQYITEKKCMYSKYRIVIVFRHLPYNFVLPIDEVKLIRSLTGSV